MVTGDDEMVNKAIRVSAALLLAASFAAPATAQDAPVNGIVYLYKATDRCPTDADGNEITVCVRRSPDEQFRIPKELRPDTMKPEYKAFAVHNAEVTEDAGAAGNGSCSTTGIGGASGCQNRAIEAWRRERAAAKAAREADQPK